MYAMVNNIYSNYIKNITPFTDKYILFTDKYIPFTDINCICLLLYKFSYYNLNTLYAISICNSFSILTTFHFSLFFDNNVFKKMQNKMKITALTFHFGNIVLHIYPCYILYKYPPTYISYYHSMISSFIYILWLYIYSDKQWKLDKVYVKLKKNHWYILHSIFIVTSFFTPYAFNKFII